MKKITVLVLMLLGAFTVDAKQKARKHTEKSADEIISVESYHTACFGRCPIFKVQLSKDGMATYTGIRFTHDSGNFNKFIGKARANAIFKHIKAYRIDTCPDRYETRAHDLPGVVLTIKYANRTKMVQNTNLGPIGLRKLNAEIDDIMASSLDSSGHLNSTWHPVKDIRK